METRSFHYATPRVNFLTGSFGANKHRQCLQRRAGSRPRHNAQDVRQHEQLVLGRLCCWPASRHSAVEETRPSAPGMLKLHTHTYTETT